MSNQLVHFTVPGKGMHFVVHHTSTDSRDVIDADGTKHLTFTSTLDVRDGKGRYAGRLFIRENRWHLRKASGEVASTETPCLGYDSMKLLRAECEAAIMLLSE